MTDRKSLHGVRFLTGTDSYKLGHWQQYPTGTTGVYSNFTARGARISDVDAAVLFGLQAFLDDWCGDAFQDFLALPEDEAVATYAARVAAIAGASDDDFARVRGLHRLGYLPLRICAVPEGTAVPLRMPMLTVENTYPDFFWLTNYIESAMSAFLWHPITSATLAHRLRTMLNGYAQASAGSTEFVGWQGHDFSLRGLEGIAAAGASGAGHLLSFTGTDSLPAMDFVDMHYPGDNGLLGGSPPATEHAVMCAGELNERDTYLRLLKLYPAGLVSVVSDTWDFWNVITEILPSLHAEIMSRDGKLVIRPDSGDPVKIICGDPDAPAGSPAQRGLVVLLGGQFGTTVNAAGYKELDSHIGMIYGDSITYERAQQMCEGLMALGYASTNIVLGVGSFTYQYVTRDTLGMAMKATWVEVDGVGRDIFKAPKTDNGTKRSAKGRLALLPDGDSMLLVEGATPEEEKASLLQPVWCDGQFLRRQSFAQVREVLWP